MVIIRIILYILKVNRTQICQKKKFHKSNLSSKVTKFTVYHTRGSLKNVEIRNSKYLEYSKGMKFVRNDTKRSTQTDSSSSSDSSVQN